MSFLKKLFGDRANDAAIRVEAPVPPSQPVGQMVKVFDEYGRPFEIPKAAWRTQILLPNLDKKRNDPEALYNLIVGALQDGYAADVLESARHLLTIDPQKLRSANLLGVVLLQLKNDSEARHVLEDAITRYGEEGYVLTNLAKAYAGLADVHNRDAILWRAMELDPNQDNGLLWYVALEKEKNGAEGETAALARVAALPKSWRAQLWIARAALARDDVETARRMYNEALSRVDPVPPDALMQISGDLGNRGQLALLLELCTPRFDVKLHGINAGNNLIKANLDLGRTTEARAILEQLYARQRPDWRQVLIDWERRIDDAEKRFGPIEGQVKVGLTSFDQPLFAYGRLGFDAVLPEKANESVRVTFVCGTGEVCGPKPTQVLVQRTDALGQVTRTVPLFLAEETYLGTSARSSVLVPVVESGGVALLGVPWDLDALVQAGVSTDVLVLLHVDTSVEPWQLQFSACRWPTKTAETTWSVPFPVSEPLPALLQALAKLVAHLNAVPGIQPTAIQPALQRPPDPQLARYVLCLENALMIGLANMPRTGGPTLWGERPIIDGLIDLAVSSPENLRARMLLLNSLEKEAQRRPDIAQAYMQKLLLLNKRYALPAGEPAGLVAAALDKLRMNVKA